MSMASAHIFNEPLFFCRYCGRPGYSMPHRGHPKKDGVHETPDGGIYFNSVAGWWCHVHRLVGFKRVKSEVEHETRAKHVQRSIDLRALQARDQHG